MVSSSPSLLWHLSTTHWSLTISYVAATYVIWAAVGCGPARGHSSLISWSVVATVCCDTRPQHTEVSLLVINHYYLRDLNCSRLGHGHVSLISWSALAVSHSLLWHMVTAHWCLIIVYKSLLLCDTWTTVVAVAQVHSTDYKATGSHSFLWHTWPQHTEISLLVLLCTLVSGRDNFLWLWVHRLLQFIGDCDIINKNIYDLVNQLKLTHGNYVNMFTGWFSIKLKSIRDNPQDIILWPEVVLY